jgi:hypothetical protein
METEYEIFSCSEKEDQSDSGDEYISDREEDQDINTVIKNGRSIFDPSTINDIDVNAGGEILLKSTILCSKNKKDGSKLPEYSIVDTDNNGYIRSYFKSKDDELDFESYEDFDESKCGICKWTMLIKNEKDKNGNPEIVIQTYPDVDQEVYDYLMTLIRKCKGEEDLTLADVAYAFYETKIRTPINNNTLSYKYSTKLLFPKIPAYEMYLHANHKRNLKDRLSKTAITYLNIFDYLNKNVGPIKINNKTGKTEPDKNIMDLMKSASDQAMKIYSSINVKNNNIKITNKTKIKN